MAGALRAADVDPMKELVDKDVVAADSQPQLVQHSTNDDTAPTTTNRLVSADINPRICLLEVNPRNCSIVIPCYSYRQSYVRLFLINRTVISPRVCKFR